MTTTILAPVDLSAAVQTGPRVWRKQILRKASIDYPTGDGKTRRVTFDDAFLTDLASAFKAGAYDNVPFVLAGADNAHTMAPERFRGWVTGVEVTDDGMDAVIELSQDAAALVERTGGKLGVSPRIKPVQHVDGRAFPRAINHVLGTLDARQQGPTLGLRDWQAVDLSTDDGGDVLDLSASTYTEGNPMPLTIDLSTMDEDARDRLKSYLIANGHDVEALAVDLSDPDDGDQGNPGEGEGADGGADEPDADTEDTGDGDEGEDGEDEGEDEGEGEGEGEGDPISDKELEALIDAQLADVALSDPADDTTDLDLSAGEHAQHGSDLVAERRESARLRAENAATRYARAGVPPHIIDLATPLLAMSDADADALDLSNPADGTPLDVRGTVVKILDACKGIIDLSAEQGHGDDTDHGDVTQDERAARILSDAGLD